MSLITQASEQAHAIISATLQGDVVATGVNAVAVPPVASSIDTSAELLVETALPHPVYFLRRDHLADAKFEPILVGHRRLVLENGSNTALAHVGVNQGNLGTTAQLLEGNAPQALMDALLAAESDPATSQNDFEVRVVEIPSLYVALLWLHLDQDAAIFDHDLFVVLPPSSTQLEVGKLINYQDVLPELTRLAKEAIELEEDVPDESTLMESYAPPPIDAPSDADPN